MENSKSWGSGREFVLLETQWLGLVVVALIRLSRFGESAGVHEGVGRRLLIESEFKPPRQHCPLLLLSKSIDMILNYYNDHFSLSALWLMFWIIIVFCRSRFASKVEKFYRPCTPRNSGPQSRDSPPKRGTKILAYGAIDWGMKLDKYKPNELIFKTWKSSMGHSVWIKLYTNNPFLTYIFKLIESCN